MQEDQTIRAYRENWKIAVRGWGRGRRVGGGKRVPPLLKKVLKEVCRPRLLSLGRVRVLDVGCGPGFDAIDFVRGGCDVLGVDATPEFVRFARRLSTQVRRSGFLRGKILRFIEGDIQTLRRRTFQGSGLFPFDLIWANASLIHLPKRQFFRVLKGMIGLTGVGGCFAGTFFHGKGEGIYGGSYIPGRFFARYEKSELVRIFLKVGFSHVNIRTVVNEDRKGRWLNVIAEI